jgi:hypothetical protein
MSRIGDLVYDLSTTEQDDERGLGPDGEKLVPWQVCTVDGLELTVHWHTNRDNEPLAVDVAEDGREVRVTVRERRVTTKLAGQRRRHAVTLSAPLEGRSVVDGASGRRREPLLLDPEVGWRRFDASAAEWLLAGARLTSIEVAARNALEDGCHGEALARLARGDGDLPSVYRERGLPLPDDRAAAKAAIDAALDEEHAESIGFIVETIAGSGRLSPDHREQLADLLKRYDDYQHALETTGNATAQAGPLLAAAHELRERGGLTP